VLNYFLFQFGVGGVGFYPAVIYPHYLRVFATGVMIEGVIGKEGIRDVLRVGLTPEIGEVAGDAANDHVERNSRVALLHCVHDGRCPAAMAASPAYKRYDVFAFREINGRGEFLIGIDGGKIEFVMGEDGEYQVGQRKRASQVHYRDEVGVGKTEAFVVADQHCEYGQYQGVF